MPKKDIFIDNNIAKNFANPADPEYKKLISWLNKYDENDRRNNAHLTVSNKIINEYKGTCGHASSVNSMPAIMDKMTREGRIVKISNKRIQSFKRVFFRNVIIRRLSCNKQDRDHIPVVLLSYRKYALSIDDKFINDLINFPGFTVRAAKRPEAIPYAL